MLNSTSDLSGKFALELEGKPAGFLRSVQGGEPFGAVVVEAPGPDGIAKKHLGGLDFEPITVTFGVGMAKELYNWIAEVCNRQQKPRSGAIVLLNYDFTEVERLEWKTGLITEIIIPALDGSAKDAAFLTITIAAEQVQTTSSSGKAQSGFATKAQKKFMASNFRFTVSKLESESKRVMRVQSLSIKQPVIEGAVGEERIPQRQPGTLQISNLFVTVPLAFGKSWLEWVDDFVVKGNSDDGSERTATLQFLDHPGVVLDRLGQQVADRYDGYGRAVLDHRQVTNVVLVHQLQTVRECLRDIDGNDIPDHDVRHLRNLRRFPGKYHPPHTITFGQNARYRPMLGDHDKPDVLVGHETHGREGAISGSDGPQRPRLCGDDLLQ